MTRVAPTRQVESLPIQFQSCLCIFYFVLDHHRYSAFFMRVENPEPPDSDPAESKGKDAPAAVDVGPIVIDWADNDPQVRLVASRVRLDADGRTR